jgi:signal transduction histidine kinase
MINDILDLAKIEAGKMDLRPEDLSVPDFCDSLLPAFRLPAERKHIDLRTLYDPQLGPVRQDAGKVRQILTNLLSNAIKFTPEAGRVTLKAAADGDWAVFTVADTGVGIPPDEQERVFDKFRQAAPSTLTREHEGTGLGLSIVRELCGLLGGEVSLQSDQGRGSTFTVRLPRVLTVPAVARRAEPPPRADGPQTPTELLRSALPAAGS